MLKRLKVLIEYAKDLHGPRPAVIESEAQRRRQEREDERQRLEEEAAARDRARLRESALAIEKSIRQRGWWWPDGS